MKMLKLMPFTLDIYTSVVYNMYREMKQGDGKDEPRAAIDNLPQQSNKAK